jgi:hypothetical protein
MAHRTPNRTATRKASRTPRSLDDVRAAKLAAARNRVAFTFGAAPAAEPDAIVDPSRYSLAILVGINRKHGAMFAGLDPQHPTKSTTKALARRRARNRVARRSRRVNSLRAA